jgi:formylglycine-generating enzyme required for sulfatase activity
VGTVAIAAGHHVHAGPGEPAPVWGFDELPPEETVWLPSFRIDRTEVTNAAFAVFASMGEITGIAMPFYMDTVPLHDAHGPTFPVSDISWQEARAYCRFLGKELPSTEQWEKAMRGGLVLPDGRANPMPARNLPWGAPAALALVNVRGPGKGRPAPVGSFVGDVSPYGVEDLAGNVQEWVDSPVSESVQVVRGGNWDDSTVLNLVDFMATENPRSAGTRLYVVGARCVLAE